MADVGPKKKIRQRWPFRVLFFIAICFFLLYVIEFMMRMADDTGQYAYHDTPPSSYNRKDKVRTYHPIPPPSALLGLNDSFVEDGFNFRDPIERLGSHAELKVEPVYGRVRPDADAVFGMARGIKLSDVIRFVGSLLETGYEGDIVLGVSQEHALEDDFKAFLKYYSQAHNVVVFPVELVCRKVKVRTRCRAYKMFQHKTIRGYLPDPRPHREINQLRFEYYWAWSTLYEPTSRIFLLDTKDLYFQQNPFGWLSLDMATTIIMFQEGGDNTCLANDLDKKLWMHEKFFDTKVLRRIQRKPVLIAGAVVGGQRTIEAYTRAMIETFDVVECQYVGCEQGFHNFLVWSNHLKKAAAIDNVETMERGRSVVNTLHLFLQKQPKTSLRQDGILNGNGQVINNNGRVTPIVHQFEEDAELRDIVANYTNQLVRVWEERLQELKDLEEEQTDKKEGESK